MDSAPQAVHVPTMASGRTAKQNHTLYPGGVPESTTAVSPFPDRCCLYVSSMGFSPATAFPTDVRFYIGEDQVGGEALQDF